MQVVREDGLELSDDPARLDVDRICAWLGDSYWAGHRDRETNERALAGSTGYGVYAPGAGQVALTRAVTDHATFAWLSDVVVDAAWRGRGIGRWLVGAVVADLAACGVARLALATRDAHGVYAPLGFTPLRAPERWLEIDTRPAGSRPG